MPRTHSSDVTFRCDDRSATATYMGRRAWEVAGPSSIWSGRHEEVAGAICVALGLEGEIPYNTKVVQVIVDVPMGTIKNNTFPTDHWWVNFDGEGSFGAVPRGLEAAIMVCLVALKLTPAGQSRSPKRSIDGQQFGRTALENAADRTSWARELRMTLTDRLRGAVDAETEANKVVNELKLIGHDLFRFDESEDFAVWMYDYKQHSPGPRLLLHFYYSAYEEPQVEVQVSAEDDAVSPS